MPANDIKTGQGLRLSDLWDCAHTCIRVTAIQSITAKKSVEVDKMIVVRHTKMEMGSVEHLSLASCLRRLTCNVERLPPCHNREGLRRCCDG
jgi:hypothetical protein